MPALEPRRARKRAQCRVAERVLPPMGRKSWGRRPTYLPENQRIVAFGDIHGRADLFSALIRAVGEKLSEMPRKSNTMLILGDFIDRGLSSAMMLDVLRRASKTHENFLVLRGNHEESLLASAYGDADAQRLWLEHGGEAFLKSYGMLPPQPDEDSFSFAGRLCSLIGTETLEWLEDLPTHYHEPPFFFCHAGVRPGVALGKQSQHDLLWIRQAFMESPQDHGAIIVHGHNVVSEVQIRDNRISLDTGAYDTGNLSAVILDRDFTVVLTTLPE